MDGTSKPLTQRKWTDILARNALMVILVAMAFGIVGPFGTYQQFSLIPRLAYWVVAVMAAWVCVEGFTVLLSTAASRFRKLPPHTVIYCSIVFSSIPIVVFLVILEQELTANVTTPQWGRTYLQVSILLSLCLMSAQRFGFELIAEIKHVRNAENTLAIEAPHIEKAKILSRLKVPISQGELISVSSEGHYVSVTTTRGSELLLMRFADAIDATAPISGVQSHRSHWVSVDQVNDLRVKAGKWEIELKDGRIVPVSRRREKLVLDILKCFN